MNGMVGVCISIIITNWRRGGDGGRKTEAARGELTVPSLNLLPDYKGNIPLSSCLSEWKTSMHTDIPKIRRMIIVKRKNIW